jgi:hypothetical protein
MTQLEIEKLKIEKGVHVTPRVINPQFKDLLPLISPGDSVVVPTQKMAQSLANSIRSFYGAPGETKDGISCYRKQDGGNFRVWRLK